MESPARPWEGRGVSPQFRHHRVGNLVIAPHGLDVVVVVKRVDQLEQRLRGRLVGDLALQRRAPGQLDAFGLAQFGLDRRSEEHTSELQSLMRISYAVFCLKKKK